MSHFNIGVEILFFKKFERKVDVMEKAERECVLVYNKMSIKIVKILMLSEILWKDLRITAI